MASGVGAGALEGEIWTAGKPADWRERAIWEIGGAVRVLIAVEWRNAMQTIDLARSSPVAVWSRAKRPT